jgi:hypothetical protein
MPKDWYAISVRGYGKRPHYLDEEEEREDGDRSRHVHCKIDQAYEMFELNSVTGKVEEVRGTMPCLRCSTSCDAFKYSKQGVVQPDPLGLSFPGVARLASTQNPTLKRNTNSRHQILFLQLRDGGAVQPLYIMVWTEQCFHAQILTGKGEDEKSSLIVES